MKEKSSSYLRKKVAREAATLLYTLQEKEYKQAKKRAAEALGVRTLPSNLEVVKEVDEIADTLEGSSRQQILLQMRKDALKIMEVLQDFHPILVGSVWRGTAHRNSDIDVALYSLSPNSVLTLLQNYNFKIEKAEWRRVTKKGKAESSFHIHVTLISGNNLEIVVRSLESQNQLKRCEIYGDPVIGLNYSQLQTVLRDNPLQRFIPKRE